MRRLGRQAQPTVLLFIVPRISLRSMRATPALKMLPRWEARCSSYFVTDPNPGMMTAVDTPSSAVPSPPSADAGNMVHGATASECRRE